MSSWKVALALIGTALFAPQQGYSQGSTGLKFGKGDTYMTARRLLEEAGFHPVPFFTKAEDCAGRDDICPVFMEAVACSGTGLAFCKFVYFYRTGEFFELITTGETAESLRVHNFVRASQQDQAAYLKYVKSLDPVR